MNKLEELEKQVELYEKNIESQQQYEKFWIVERKLTKAEIESVNPILMQIAKEVE